MCSYWEIQQRGCTINIQMNSWKIKCGKADIFVLSGLVYAAGQEKQLEAAAVWIFLKGWHITWEQ